MTENVDAWILLIAKLFQSALGTVADVRRDSVRDTSNPCRYS